MSICKHLAPCVWLLAASCIQPHGTTAARQIKSIDLDGVPDRLTLPLPEGVNQVLTARIKGGEVRGVWLGVMRTQARDRRVALTRIGESDYAINLASAEVHDLLSSYEPAGQFCIFAQDADGSIAESLAIRYAMHAAPQELDFPFDKAQMTIFQRTSKKLPGTNPTRYVHVGDVTGGFVPVSIRWPGESAAGSTLMSKGDAVLVTLADQQFMLQLDALVNRLVGDDYGVFSLMPLGSWEAQHIEDLLELIAHSDVVFMRNDDELSGTAFASHLRAKREFQDATGISLREFIETIASRSSMTGKPYRVKLPSGDVMDLAAWLQEQAKTLPSHPAPVQSAAAAEARPLSTCRLDQEAHWQFLDSLEESGAKFTCNGAVFMSAAEIASFQRLFLASRQGESTPCFDDFWDQYIAGVERAGDLYQVTLPDGRTLRSADWLRALIVQAVERAQARRKEIANHAPERKD